MQTDIRCLWDMSGRAVALMVITTLFFLDNEQDMKHPMRYQELRDDYKDTEAIGIPHHVAYQLGSRGKNWATHDENFSPFAEIYSSHGCSEK